MRNLLLGMIAISLLVSGSMINLSRTDGRMLAAASAYTWWQEAEAGSRSAPMTTGQDTGASNCAFVYTSERDRGAVTFSFSVPQSGYYYIWARARGANEWENSFFFSIDGGTEGQFEIHPWDNQWHWIIVHLEGQSEGPYYLSAGSHTLRFRGREPGSHLDVVWVTDSSSAPSGVPNPCVTPSPTPIPPPGCYTYQVVPFNWIDISSTGAVVAQGDDTYTQVSLGFAFPFCGTYYTEAFVCSNGFVSFGAGYAHLNNTAIPTTDPPNNAIYAFWDDLIPAGGADGNVYARQLDANRYVIQWQRVRKYGTSGDFETFEIVLNRSDGTILLQYLSVANTGSATVGIEEADGRSATQYCYNTPNCVTNGLALLFTPGVQPARPVVSPSSFSVSLVQGGSASRQMTIANQGQTELSFSLRDLASASLAGVPGQLEILASELADVDEPGNSLVQGATHKAKVTYQGLRTDLNILVYTDDFHFEPGQTFVERALQRLGISYQGYYGDPDGFAGALPSRQWDAVLISHNNYFALGQQWPALESYFNRGGRLVIETFDMDGSHSAQTTLWNTLGVAYVSDVDAATAMYRWQPGHAIFNTPNAVPNLTSSSDEYTDNGDRANGAGATAAIGGFTTSAASGQGNVFARADQRAVVDSFIVSEHRGDLDGDGILDAVELWENEISYVLRLSDAAWLTYSPTSGTVAPGGQRSVTVYFNASGLAIGTYNANLLVSHNGGSPNPIVVPVTLIVSAVSPTPTRTPSTYPVATNTPTRIRTPGPVRLPIIMRQSPPTPQELGYDDGGKENLAMAASSGRYMEVRFNVGTRKQVLKLRYYMAQLGNSVRLYVRNASGDLYSREVTPSVSGGEGWFERDVAGENIFVQGEFRAGFETRAGGGPALGVDQTPPIDLQSFAGPMPPPPFDQGDLMIRVVVQ